MKKPRNPTPTFFLTLSLVNDIEHGAQKTSVCYMHGRICGALRVQTPAEIKKFTVKET